MSYTHRSNATFNNPVTPHLFAIKRIMDARIGLWLENSTFRAASDQRESERETMGVKGGNAPKGRLVIRQLSDVQPILCEPSVHAVRATHEKKHGKLPSSRRVGKFFSCPPQQIREISERVIVALINFAFYSPLSLSFS